MYQAWTESDHVHMCVTGVMYICVLRGPCTYVCYGGHVHMCVTGVMYICVLRESCTYVCYGGHVHMCVTGVMYICVLGVMYICVLRGSCTYVLRISTLSLFLRFSLGIWIYSDRVVFCFVDFGSVLTEWYFVLLILDLF